MTNGEKFKEIFGADLDDDKYKSALETVKRHIDLELLRWEFIDVTEAKNAFSVTLRSLADYIKGVLE